MGERAKPYSTPTLALKKGKKKTVLYILYLSVN